jgi:hypothetical protein
MDLKRLLRAFVGVNLMATFAAFGGSDPVKVSTGYFDLSSPVFYAGQTLPDPWYGSPNTTFFGSVGQATSSDPDEDAILLQNLSGSSVTLSALNIGGAFNLFSMNGVAGSVSLAPGQYYIFAGVDGSDTGFTSVVNLTVGGTAYSYNDVTSVNYPGGALHGYPVSTNETVPWTPVYTPPSTSNVPDSASTLLLVFGGLAPMLAIRRRLARN